jgi:hypothetical protein
MKAKGDTQAMARLLKEAKRRSMKDADLARKLDVTRSVVCGWKTRGIPIARLDEVARRMEITTEFLKTGLDVGRFHHQLSEEQRRILDAVAVLDDKDKERLVKPLLDEADRIKRYLGK